MLEKIKKGIVALCSTVLGVVFIFSGFVKAVDPLGGAYKMHDYFSAFHLDFLNILELPLSLALSIVEFLLGIFVLLRLYTKFTAVCMFAFMLFMTALSFYLALADPVSDCGCFGDAFIISNWQTFYKNFLILLPAAFILMRWQSYTSPIFTEKINWLISLYSLAFILLVSLYSYQYLPILDFRPYKIGADIPLLMSIPLDAETDEYETSFVYEKNGEQKEFTIDNYPADDSTWIFVDSKNILIKEGYKPAIHDFNITNAQGDDITDIILADTGYTFLMISTKLDKAADTNVDNINEIYDYAQRFDHSFYCLTASSQKDISDWIQYTGAEYPICISDETTLKTIVRSNPGLVLIHNGIIVGKWHHNNLPKYNDLIKPLNEQDWGLLTPISDSKKVLVVFMILFIPLFLLWIWDFFYYRKKKDIIDKEDKLTKKTN